jgi:hypothetical protein
MPMGIKTYMQTGGGKTKKGKKNKEVKKKIEGHR